MTEFENWQDSGRFLPRKEFLSRFPTIKLLGACDDVVLYDGGYYIQVLFDGTFYESNTNRSKKLDEVEMNMFLEKIARKLD
jgi:hypothetical protein